MRPDEKSRSRTMREVRVLPSNKHARWHGCRAADLSTSPHAPRRYLSHLMARTAFYLGRTVTVSSTCCMVPLISLTQPSRDIVGTTPVRWQCLIRTGSASRIQVQENGRRRILMYEDDSCESRLLYPTAWPGEEKISHLAGQK